MGPGAAPDPLPEIHRDLQNHLSAHRLALVELPRDHGKTTQVCLRVLWELGRNPDSRIKIVCAILPNCEIRRSPLPQSPPLLQHQQPAQPLGLDGIAAIATIVFLNGSRTPM